MKLKAIAIASALALASSAWAASARDEPIEPIQAAKVTNPAPAMRLITIADDKGSRTVNWSQLRR